MDIQGLIFDFGGVIWNMRWDACHALEQEHGLPRGAVFQTLYRTETWRAIERGSGDRRAWLDEAHRALEERAGRPLPRLHEIWRERQHLLSENVALIRALRPPYRTAVLSNADISLRARIEQELRIHDLFDAIICSAEVGLAKPDLAIYRLAADRLGLPPDACLFVDDYEPNIQAAEEAGM
ncbi:MAG: HAD family phosphatase, partial [candidate division NC10 bacterium]